MRILIETGKTEVDATEVTKAEGNRLASMLPLLLSVIPTITEWIHPCPKLNKQWSIADDASALGKIHGRLGQEPALCDTLPGLLGIHVDFAVRAVVWDSYMDGYRSELPRN